MNNNATGVRYQILVDGVPRTNRDDRTVALAAAAYLRQKNPAAKVEVREIQTGRPVTFLGSSAS
jgi:hypothetical protein